jgi:predicted nucleic acid-binding Zn ribbon protein
MRAPENCPVCGADVPRGASACPECGSDESTGWSDRAHAQSLDLPDEEFNYGEFVEREFGEGKRPARIHWIWWATAVILIALSVWFLLGRR